MCPEQDTFKTLMINFGSYATYEGPDLEQAKNKAVTSGYEAAIMKNDRLYKMYSPISGWRKYQ